jgi:hypothetical protein
MFREMLIDYRDRVSVLVWVALMGLAAQRLLALPTVVITGPMLGSPVTLTITTNTVLGVILAGLVASGTEAVVRAHPASQSGESGPNWLHWGAPVALIGVALLLLPAAPSRLYWLMGLVLTGSVLGLSLAGIYHTMDPFATGYRRSRLAMNALTYGIALVTYLVVYRTRVRSIVSATEIMLVSTLLALELLRGSQRPTTQIALYAIITGVVLGQATWVLNYVRLQSLTGGLILLLLFYNIVGLSQHAVQGHVRRRVVVEFGLITIAALALIWEFAPRAGG